MTARLVREEIEELADRSLPAHGIRQREVVLHVVPVPATVSLLDDVPRVAEISDDGVGGALRDVESDGQIPQPGVRLVRDEEDRPGVVGEEAP